MSKCPQCGFVEQDPMTAIRQCNCLPGVIDVAYECGRCHHEYGFEVFQERHNHE